jgi:hypothetical protein
LKGKINEGIVDLKNSGNQNYIDQANVLDNYSKNEGGDADLKNSSMLWVRTLRDYITVGYYNSEKTAIDFTDLRAYGSGKGIPASDMGSPTFDWDPIYRLGNLSQFSDYATNHDWTNVHQLVKELGVKLEYNPNSKFSITSAFKIELGPAPWELINNKETLEMGVKIANHKNFDFRVTLKGIYDNADKKLNKTVNLFVNWDF